MALLHKSGFVVARPEVNIFVFATGLHGMQSPAHGWRVWTKKQSTYLNLGIPQHPTKLITAM